MAGCPQEHAGDERWIVGLQKPGRKRVGGENEEMNQLNGVSLAPLRQKEREKRL